MQPTRLTNLTGPTNPTQSPRSIGESNIPKPTNDHVQAVRAGQVSGPIATLQPDCDADDKQSIGLGPDLQFFTIAIPAGQATAMSDVAIQVPKASKFIMLVSCPFNHMNDSLFMHFTPLQLNWPTAAIIPTGVERWFPFCNGSAGATAMTKIGLFYKFKKNLPQTIYFDIGVEANTAGYFLTFVVGNDVDMIGQLMNSTS